MENQLHDPARQRAQVLALLKRHGALSTTQLRDAGVMHPAGRIAELRSRGHLIDTVRHQIPASDGRTHVQALYVLCGGVQ